MEGIKSTEKNITFYNSLTGGTFTESCDVVFEGNGNFETIIIVRYGDKFQDFFYDKCENAFRGLTDINNGIEPKEVWADLDSDPFGTVTPILVCPRWFNLSTLCEIFE